MARCLVVFLFLICGWCGAESAGLLTNGGFEAAGGDGKVPPQWRAYVPRRTATIEASEENPVEGTRCVNIATTEDLTAILVSEPPQEVAPGEVLTLKVHCRAEGLASDSGGWTAFNACFLNEQNRIILWDRKRPQPAADGSWTETTHTVRAPDTAAYVMFQFGLKSARGKTWWDAAELVTSTPIALRLQPGKEGPTFGETTMSAVLLNRLQTPGARNIEIISNPGNHRTRVAVENSTTRPVTLPFTFSSRGNVMVSAEVIDSDNGRRLFLTTQTLSLSDAIVVDPLLPTHFVMEDPGPPAFEAELSVNVAAEQQKDLMLATTVKDATGSVVAQTSGVAVIGNRAKVRLELPQNQKKAPADFSVSFELLQDGKKIASAGKAWHIIRRAQSHVTVSPDSFPVVDGQKFFPIALYMTPPSRFAEVKKAGFNLMQSYPAFAGPGSSNRTVESFLNDVHAAGLKALTFVSHGQDRLSDADALKRIRTFKNHPAILVWYQEEVLARGYKPYSYLENHVAMLRREAPEHPILQGDQRGESYAMIGNPRFFPDELMDFGTWWWYPTPLREKPSVENYEGFASGPEKEYKPPQFLVDSGTTKPIWVAMQSYKKPNQSDARFPTPAEYRAQAYIAICHGAKGLLYYTGTGEGGHGILARPEEGHWEYLKKLVGELRDMSPVFMSADADKEAEVVTSGALVSVRLKQTKKGRVLLAVNRSIEPVKTQIRVPRLKGTARVRGEDRVVKPEDNVLTDQFESYGVHVYELAE